MYREASRHCAFIHLGELRPRPTCLAAHQPDLPLYDEAHANAYPPPLPTTSTSFFSRPCGSILQRHPNRMLCGGTGPVAIRLTIRMVYVYVSAAATSRRPDDPNPNYQDNSVCSARCRSRQESIHARVVAFLRFKVYSWFFTTYAISSHIVSHRRRT